MLGEFLEISIESQNVLESVRFYERLGFKQVTVGDVWDHHYGVVTDGRLFLGLHNYSFPSPSLTFVAPPILRRIRELEAINIDFEFRKLDIDQFHEAGFFDPDGQMVCLLEARTYHLPQLDHDNFSLCGFFNDYRLPVRNADESKLFWEKLGLMSLHDDDDDIPVMCAKGINIALDEDRRLRTPMLSFHTNTLEQIYEQLDARQIPVEHDRRNDALRIRTPDAVDIGIFAAPEH
ncbi:MAG: hypothetical protein MJA83_07890 [Gammaproteobacteria bacterium]|nr:hypothetical protein [Gammaproteobacteria bacterium]